MANPNEDQSIILRSTQILLIRIEGSKASDWETDENDRPNRFVDLTIRLEEILKGRVRNPKGSQVQVRVSQVGRQGTRYYAVPGVWSDHPIDPGTRLVAFSRASQDEAATLLVEPALQRLLSPEESLLDVRLAMQAQTQSLPLPRLLSIAQPNAAALDYVFAEYLGAVLDDHLLASPSDFDALMSFLEDPAVSMPVRSTLVKFVSSALLAVDPAPNRFVARAVLMMSRQLAMPQAAALHANIAEVFLPNLLGLRGGASRKKAADLFAAAPQDRKIVEGILEHYQGASGQTLRMWLAER